MIFKLHQSYINVIECNYVFKWLKKEVDDEVVVKTPEGDKEWFINRGAAQQELDGPIDIATNVGYHFEPVNIICVCNRSLI